MKNNTETSEQIQELAKELESLRLEHQRETRELREEIQKLKEDRTKNTVKKT